jgi:hypothetical protein
MPGIDLLALQDLKDWLSIPAAVDDTLISSLITSVSAEILQQIGRGAIVTASYTETRDGTGTSTMALKYFPITAVASLKIDTTLVQPSPDGVQPGFVFDDYVLKLVGVPPYLNSGGSVQLWTAPWVFRCGKMNIVVNYTAGYAAVPADLSQAAKEICALRYIGRKRIGLKSTTSKTGESSTFDTARWPESAMYVIQTYKRIAPV